jgi:hypothetical protein
MSKEDEHRRGWGSKLWDHTSGSITLEASMLFPWIVMITFLLLLFSLFVSQGALLYYSSSITAERAAFSWSNSAKATQTGAYPMGQYDGLYWRLFDDSLVQGLFGLVTEHEGVNVELSSAIQGSAGSTPKDKLMKAGLGLASSQEGLDGVMSYRNIGVMRQVKVELTSGWLPEPLVWIRGEDKALTQSSALVVEPTEFIRSFDLVRYYAAKMKTAPEGKEAYRDKAALVLNKRSS